MQRLDHMAGNPTHGHRIGLSLPVRSAAAGQLADVLALIAEADAAANHHFERSRQGDNRDTCAAAAQAADERAGHARTLARHLIEQAFPGIAWPMIEKAGL